MAFGFGGAAVRMVATGVLFAYAAAACAGEEENPDRRSERRVSVDKLEEGVAVLLPFDERLPFTVARDLLPKGVHEGAVLVGGQLSKAESEALARQVKEARERIVVHVVHLEL